MREKTAEATEQTAQKQEDCLIKKEAAPFFYFEAAFKPNNVKRHS